MPRHGGRLEEVRSGEAFHVSAYNVVTWNLFMYFWPSCISVTMT